ncbi:hypothetical protein HDU93_001816 [Gonapodya sp. JEL0774]|nr:hypothetical protein HDU93_001816 [Gonapodya sp. JEL0774]
MSQITRSSSKFLEAVWRPRFTRRENHRRALNDASSSAFSLKWNRQPYFTEVGTQHQPLRFAIVGSGPAGFYTADKLLGYLPNATVDLFEKLPFPYGLARYGVAPDHPEVKNVVNKFDSIAASPRVRFFGGVSFPSDIDLPSLKAYYDAVILSYGATLDRRLGIPGEDAKGVLSAREFVAWYNGMPGFSDLKVDLESTDHAVIIGHGNVALDVARMLLSPVEWLAKTDMSQYAVEKLSRSRVRKVTLIGRRGPLQIAFTAKELREMFTLPRSRLLIDADLLSREVAAGTSVLDHDRPRKRLMGILEKGLDNADSVATKKTRSRGNIENDVIIANTSVDQSWELKFWRTPKEVLTSTTVVSSERNVRGLMLTINVPSGPSNNPRSIATEETEILECGVIFRSIGYRSIQVDGVPFDEERGVVPNIRGRVYEGAIFLKPTSIPTPFKEFISEDPIPGLYVSGWLKRGPTGVIASTLLDAQETAASIFDDVAAGTLRASARDPEGAHIVEALKSKGVHPVTYEDWKVLEKEEERRGAAMGKPREKITDSMEVAKLLGR